MQCDKKICLDCARANSREPHFRTRLARERVTGEAQEARLLGHECQWCFASLPGSIYLMHVCETHATDDVMLALRLRLQQLVGAENGDARLYIFGDNGALSTNMAAASLDAERGLAVLAKPPGSGMGAKEDPTFDNELFGAGCEQERRTIPWAEDMRTLLASVDECPTMHKPSLTGLASNSAPSDDPDTMAIQQSILWDWVGRAGTLVSSTDQATELLRAALPTHSECTALLTLPMSLQTGFLKVNIGQFNIEIADFADRAMRLRCCSEKEAWRICQTPLLTAAASLGELFEPLQHLPEAAAFDLHWYELARPSVWFWLLLEETSRQLQRTVSDSTELPAARDGSFLLMALKSLKGSTAKTRTPPIHYCSALLPMQVLFYAVRQLLDRPNDFPHLKITEVFWEHVENNVMEGPGYALGVRIAASFETADICPLQWEVAKRIRRSFEQGVVALHHPSVMPSIFSHPATYKGRFRIFLPISQEALGLRPSKPALQPANLLASALERVRQWSQLTGFDLRAAAGAYLAGPKQIHLWFPEHLWRLGSYELTNTMAEIVRRDFAALPSDGRGQYDPLVLGGRSVQEWQDAVQAFLAQGGLGPGLNYPFLGHRLFPEFHKVQPAFAPFTDTNLNDRRKQRDWQYLYCINDEQMVNPAAWRPWLTESAERWLPDRA